MRDEDVLRVFDNGITTMDFAPTVTERRGLVVAFNHYLSTNPDAAAFGEAFLTKRGFDVLGVKPRSNIWFNDLTESDVAQAVAAVRGDGPVYTYGSSMGAYAAIYFASAANANRAIAVSPQATIDRAVVPWEPRWPEEVGRFSFEHKPVWEAVSATVRYFVIYDRFHPFERKHVNLIAQLLPTQFVHISVPNAGHTAFEMLDEAKISSEFMAPFFDEAEPTALTSRDLIRKARRKSFVYHFNLVGRLIEAGRSRGLQRYIKRARKLARTERFQSWATAMPKL